jgi:hypothetical protein
MKVDGQRSEKADHYLGHSHFIFMSIPLRTAMRYDQLVGGSRVMISGNAPAVIGTQDYVGNYPKLKFIEEVYRDSPLMEKSIPEKMFPDGQTFLHRENRSSNDLLFEISDRLVDLSNLVSSARMIHLDDKSHDNVPTHDGTTKQPLSTASQFYPPLVLVEEIPELEVASIFTRRRSDTMMQDRRSQRNMRGPQYTSKQNLYDERPLEAKGMGEMEPPFDMHRLSIHGASSHRRPIARQDSFQSHTSHDYRSSSLSSSVSHSHNAYHSEGTVVPPSNFALTRQPLMQRASSFRRRGSHDSSMQDIPYQNGPSFENPQQYLDSRSQHSVGPRYNVSSMERVILEEPDSPVSRSHLYADDVRQSGYPPPDEDDQHGYVSNRNSRYNAMRRNGDARVEYNSERHMGSYAAENHWNNGNFNQPSYQRRLSHQQIPTNRESQYMMKSRPELSASHHYSSRTSFSSATELSNSSRMLPQTMVRSSMRPTSPYNEGRRTIEISPGLFATIRGAEETKQAIERNFVIHPDCMSCSMNLTCIADADYVICPDCKVISPSGSNIVHSNDLEGGGGVGLGVRTR